MAANPAMKPTPWQALAQLFQRRTLTEGERAELHAQRELAKQQAALKATLHGEAVEYADAIRATLTRYGVAKDLRDDDGKKWTREVRFYTPYVASEEVIKIKVNTRHLPNGVSLADLRDERVLELLSVNCGRTVSFRYTPEGGFWYWVERAAGVGGVPRYVAFEEMLSRRPANINRLGVPMGVGENKRDRWVTIPELVHLLVCGSPDGGKSNFINVLICSLLKYNTPEQLKLVLVDLKGGMEFNFYEGLPHIVPMPRYALSPKRKTKQAEKLIEQEPEDTDAEAAPLEAGEGVIDERYEMSMADELAQQFDIQEIGKERAAIVEHRRELPGVLFWLIRESERRMKLIKAAKCKKLSEYNQKNPFHPMPRILLVVDEWADVRLDEEVGSRCERMLINLCNRARAVGIHVIACTQSPVKEVVTAQLRNAFVSKMAFGMSDRYISISLIGSDQAADIKHAGRALLRVGKEVKELQVPRIPNHMVDEYVETAKGGKVVKLIEKRKHDVSDQEILDWAMRDNGGKLDRVSIYENFHLRGYTADEAQRFGKRFENQVVVANEIECKVMPPAGMFSARRLIPVEDPTPEKLAE